MVVYSNTTDVRELARSVLATEFSDAEILKEQAAAQSKIWTVTQKDDWTALDFQYEYIKKLETKQAAIYVLEHYNIMDIQPVIDMWQKEINTSLVEVAETIESGSTVSEADLEIASKPYQTFPLNPDALISRGRLAKVGFSGIGSDTGVTSKYDL